MRIIRIVKASLRYDFGSGTCGLCHKVEELMLEQDLPGKLSRILVVKRYSRAFEERRDV